MNELKEQLNETLYSKIGNLLREDILNGVFEPGERLIIADLIQRYGVSQMPIREALQQLQGEALIIMLPQRGARVSKIDESLISNMYDIRASIEAMLATRALHHMSIEGINQLEQIESKFEAAVSEQDITAQLMHNENFHRVINSSARNPEATRIIDRHWALIDSLRRKFGFSQSRMEEVIEDHREMICAFKEQDEERLANVTMKHVLEAKEDLISRMKAL